MSASILVVATRHGAQSRANLEAAEVLQEEREFVIGFYDSVLDTSGPGSQAVRLPSATYVLRRFSSFQRAANRALRILPETSEQLLPGIAPSLKELVSRGVLEMSPHEQDLTDFAVRDVLDKMASARAGVAVMTDEMAAVRNNAVSIADMSFGEMREVLALYDLHLVQLVAHLEHMYKWRNAIQPDNLAKWLPDVFDAADVSRDRLDVPPVAYNAFVARDQVEGIGQFAQILDSWHAAKRGELSQKPAEVRDGLRADRKAVNDTAAAMAGAAPMKVFGVDLIPFQLALPFTCVAALVIYLLCAYALRGLRVRLDTAPPWGGRNLDPSIASLIVLPAWKEYQPTWVAPALGIVVAAIPVLVIATAILEYWPLWIDRSGPTARAVGQALLAVDAPLQTQVTIRALTFTCACLMLIGFAAFVASHHRLYFRATSREPVLGASGPERVED